MFSGPYETIFFVNDYLAPPKLLLGLNAPENWVKNDRERVPSST